MTAEATRITTGTFESDATRALAAVNDKLQAEMKATRQSARETAEQMTKDQLVTAINDMAGCTLCKTTAPKGELVDLYTNMVAKASAASQEWTRLQYEAYRDGKTARRIDDMLDAADQIEEEIREFTAGADARELTMSLPSRLESRAETRAIATYAEIVRNAVNRGTDIREAVNRALALATAVVFEFPAKVETQGMGGAHRWTAVLEATAAAHFTRKMVLDLELATVPATRI